MAFEMPLEADQVGDAGTPLLLRPIMWMLGGDAAKQQMDDEDEQHDDGEDTLTNESTGSPPQVMHGISEINEDDDEENDNINVVKSRSPPRSGKRKASALPGVVRASDGDFDGSSSEEEEQLPAPPKSGGGVVASTAATQIAALSLSECKSSSITSSGDDTSPSPGRLTRSNRFHQQHLKTSSRKLSWSNDLATVTYYSQGVCQASSNPDLSAKPIKSAMKKSGPAFVRGGAATAPAPSSDTGGFGGKKLAGGSASASTSSRPNPSKYLPSGIVGGKGGGVRMPSGGGIGSYYPSGSSTSNTSRESSAGSAGSGGPASGNFSPQWGWYISTTPPTPEKYYVAPKKGSKGKTSDQPLGNVPETKPAEHPAPVFHHSNPSPVFKKGGIPSATMGWPSVPL